MPLASDCPAPPHATAPIEIAGVTLAVRDLEAVVAFYRDVVGLGLIDRAADRARLGADGRGFLELLARPDFLPVDPTAAGLYHTAFLLPSRSDLGVWLRHAAQGGVRLDGAADHLVSEAVYLHDPEGNGVEIYADRPRSEWTRRGGQIVMANDRLDMIGLRALATAPWGGAPAGTRIGHVHLQVGAIDAAAQFYAGVLGFEVTRSWPHALFLSTGGYHHHVAANTWRSADAGPRDANRAGLAALHLQAADAGMLEQVAARSGADPAAGVADPWGTLIRFTDFSRSLA